MIKSTGELIFEVSLRFLHCISVKESLRLSFVQLNCWWGEKEGRGLGRIAFVG